MHVERGTFFAAAMTVMGCARARATAAGANAVPGAAAEHNPRPDARGSMDKAPAEKADADDAIASSSTAAGSPNGRIDDPAPIPALNNLPSLSLLLLSSLSSWRPLCLVNQFVWTLDYGLVL